MNQSKWKFWEFWVLRSKFTKFLSVLKQQITFSLNFASLFSVMRHTLLFCTLLGWNVLYFQQKDPIKVKIWWISSEQSKVYKIFHTLIQERRERERGEVYGVDIIPIKKLLKFSAVINVQAILRRTHWRCSGKKVFLKEAALK